MQMVLTVKGSSQVPVYSGCLFPSVPLSFLRSSNVSLRSWLYLQCTQCPIQLLLEVWLLLYVLYVWLDSGVHNWNGVGWRHRCVVIWLLMNCRVSLPALLGPILPRSCHFFFVVSVCHSSHFFFRLWLPYQKNTCLIDITKWKIRSCQLWSVSSQKALWSSAVSDRRPGLALYTGLNQSGSWWTQVHLSQMLICRAQLRGQRHFTCMWCKITWAGMPSSRCLGFCSWPRDRCDTLARAKCPFPPWSSSSHRCG